MRKPIARVMASTKVSPKGLGSGIRMIQYFINRGGKNVSAAKKKSWRRQKPFSSNNDSPQKNRRAGAPLLNGSDACPCERLSLRKAPLSDPHPDAARYPASR